MQVKYKGYFIYINRTLPGEPWSIREINNEKYNFKTFNTFESAVEFINSRTKEVKKPQRKLKIKYFIIGALITYLSIHFFNI